MQRFCNSIATWYDLKRKDRNRKTEPGSKIFEKYYISPKIITERKGVVNVHFKKWGMMTILKVFLG